MDEMITNILADYSLPDPLGFGVELAPILYRATYSKGTWSEGGLVPFEELRINPAATCVQFGQQCFEGMKAYRVNSEKPLLFRPERNFSRLSRSAARLCMPGPTAELFANALSQMTMAMAPFIPGQSGQSLYLRPTLLGLDPTFAVCGSDRVEFILIASPSDAYYTRPITVMVEREQVRAGIGGTGAEKVGGNYAASLQATNRAEAAGFDQPLWLDGATRSMVEELSGMNFMAVIDGDLHTPALSGTILPGVTRASLLELAEAQGMKTVERDIPVAELMEAVQTGECSEMFACGTGAIVSPIAEIGEADGTRHALNTVDKVAGDLKARLLDIQEGRAGTNHDWTIEADQTDILINRLSTTL